MTKEWKNWSRISFVQTSPTNIINKDLKVKKTQTGAIKLNGGKNE